MFFLFVVLYFVPKLLHSFDILKGSFMYIKLIMNIKQVKHTSSDTATVGPVGVLDLEVATRQRSYVHFTR